MKQTKEQIEAYKAMSQAAQPAMEECVRKHLEEHCLKYKGNEDKFDRCIKHLYETVLEMLGGEDAAVDNQLSGQVPAQTCFKICTDYFDDEIWKLEDEEAAKERAEAERRKNELKAKQAMTAKKKKKSNVITAHLSDVGKDEDKDETEVEEEDEEIVTPPKKPQEKQLDFFAALGV